MRRTASLGDTTGSGGMAPRSPHPGTVGASGQRGGDGGNDVVTIATSEVRAARGAA